MSSFKNISVQSIIALMLVAATIYLFVAQQQVPESLIALLGAIIAFYFRPSDDEDLEVNEDTSN